MEPPPTKNHHNQARPLIGRKWWKGSIMSVTDVLDRLAPHGASAAPAPVPTPYAKRNRRTKGTINHPAGGANGGYSCGQPRKWFQRKTTVDDTEPNLEEVPETSGAFTKYKHLLRIIPT